MRAVTSRTRSALGASDRRPPPLSSRRRTSKAVAPTTVAAALAVVTTAALARDRVAEVIVMSSERTRGQVLGGQMLPSVTVPDRHPVKPLKAAKHPLPGQAVGPP